MMSSEGDGEFEKKLTRLAMMVDGEAAAPVTRRYTLDNAAEAYTALDRDA